MRFLCGSGTFYFSDVSGDWTVPQNNTLWQDNIKTLFDPCPVGWRVPQSGDNGISPWHAFSIDNSIWNGKNTDPLGGRTYNATVVHGTTTAWYPASGFREATSLFVHGGAFTHHWPSTAGFQFHTNASGVNPEYPYDVRIRGYSVRCIRE